MKENLIVDKSFAFALRVVKLYRHLCDKKKEFVLSKQLLKSGTSVGANVREATQAQSRKDFSSKMNIALKEAVETEYWLELLFQAEYLEKKEYDSVICDCQEVIKLLHAIVKTTTKQ